MGPASAGCSAALHRRRSQRTSRQPIYCGFHAVVAPQPRRRLFAPRRQSGLPAPSRGRNGRHRRSARHPVCEHDSRRPGSSGRASQFGAVGPLRFRPRTVAFSCGLMTRAKSGPYPEQPSNHPSPATISRFAALILGPTDRLTPSTNNMWNGPRSKTSQHSSHPWDGAIRHI